MLRSVNVVLLLLFLNVYDIQLFNQIRLEELNRCFFLRAFVQMNECLFPCSAFRTKVDSDFLPAQIFQVCILKLRSNHFNGLIN